VCCFAPRLNNPLTFSRLVSLQSAILDNQTSLDQVVQKIDGILEEDEGFPLVCSQPCCEFTLTILHSVVRSSNVKLGYENCERTMAL